MNSAMRRYEPVSGIEGVAPFGTATGKLANNRRHLMLKIYASGTIAAAPVTNPLLLIDTVTLQVRGKTMREVSAADLVNYRSLIGLGADPSDALCIYFADPARAAVNDELLSAWDTFGGDYDFTIKIKFLGTGITNLACKVIDVYDSSVFTDASNNKVRQILKQTPINYNFGSVGDIVNLPLDLPIQRLILKGASQVITHVRVKINDTETVFDLDNAENKSVLNDYKLVSTAYGANSFPLCFDVEQQLLKRLEGIRSLQVTVTSAAPQAVVALLEQAAPDYF